MDGDNQFLKETLIVINIIVYQWNNINKIKEMFPKWILQ